MSERKRKTWDVVRLAMTTSRVTTGAFVLLVSLATSNDATARSDRPLYVFAPSTSDARLARQQAINAAARGGFQDRDMSVSIVAGVTGATGLRSRFGVSPRQFRVILVGKDGGMKLSSASPVSAAELFRVIDAMPMRRLEMRNRGR